jgi:hypothetical protein
MGKKSRDVVTLAPPGSATEDLQRTSEALRWSLEGKTYEEIGARLDVSAWEAREIVSIAYTRQQTETVDELRTQSELRILDVIRRINADLLVATTQTEKLALYKLLLAAEADRRKLLGLDIPSGVQDA